MNTPDLSVVLVTPDRFANIRRTVRALRAQTVRDRLELVLVAPDEQALGDAGPDECAGFHAVRRVLVGPIPNVDAAAAAGILTATAPAVSTIEDHAFPDPEWAEAVIAAFEGPWDVVGSLMMNANPRGAASWVNLLIAYGPWAAPAPAGERHALPGHNISYRRERLLAVGDRLPRLLVRGGGLLDELRAGGARFYLAPAPVYHINPSRWRSTARLRFQAGRLYGATRAAAEGWSPAKRALYVAGGPLIPAVRFRRVTAELLGEQRRAALGPRIYPALLAGLVLDGLGQMAGYALGPGGAPAELATFEMDRGQHLDRRDRALFYD